MHLAYQVEHEYDQIWADISLTLLMTSLKRFAPSCSTQSQWVIGAMSASMEGWDGRSCTGWRMWVAASFIEWKSSAKCTDSMEDRNGQDFSEIPEPVSHLFISFFVLRVIVIVEWGRRFNLHEKKQDDAWSPPEEHWWLCSPENHVDLPSWSLAQLHMGPQRRKRCREVSWMNHKREIHCGQKDQCMYSGHGWASASVGVI